MTIRKRTGFMKVAAAMFAVALFAGTLAADTGHDSQIQATVTRKLAKREFNNVNASVADGIVTLSGTVDLYQNKLDAAKLARKVSNAQGVRNLLSVAGANVPDAQLEQKLAKKLRYVRVGYDNAFDYFALGVKDGVVTVEGQDRTGIGRDEALADIASTSGVKDVIEHITVEPVSQFDDGLRLRALRVIYGDTVLNKYAIDPARPIRIIVANGHLTLYGSVDSPMDKNIAGIRANQLFGAFSVDNKLQVEGKSGQQKL